MLLKQIAKRVFRLFVAIMSKIFFSNNTPELSIVTRWGNK